MSVPVAQWIARWTSNPKVPGSNPGRDTSLHFDAHISYVLHLLQPGQPGGEDRVLQEALAVSKSLQRATHSKRFSGRKSSNYSESESDYAPGGSRQMSRRLTVKEMTKQFQDSDGGDRPVLDLQKNFLKRMKTVGKTQKRP